MYQPLFLKALGYKVPFHQKLLRFNYDLPLAILCEVFQTMTSFLDTKEVLWAKDRWEYDGIVEKEAFPFDFHQLLESQSLYEVGTRVENGELALFNRQCTWYLRLTIERKENLGIDEMDSGNFLLFASDDVLLPLAKALENIEGHLILEGAKKYLEETVGF